MNNVLARWLTDNRDTLLPRWIAALDYVPHALVGTVQPDAGSSPPIIGEIEHAHERRALLSSIYAALIEAAEGNYQSLDECLRLLRALRTNDTEEELPEYLALSFQLRRVAWDLMFHTNNGTTNSAFQGDGLELAATLDQLIEYMTIQLSANWIHSAQQVARELHETKLLVESLYHDAEATDRTTLFVSILNEISQGLSASMDRHQQIEIVSKKLRGELEIATLTIWLFDQASHILYAVGHWSEQPVNFDTWQITPDSSDIIARAFQTADLVFEEIPDAPAQGPWLTPPSVVLAVPLITQRRVMGVMALQDVDASKLRDRSEQDFVKSVASQAAIAMENARLYEEVRSFNLVLEERIAERTNELKAERDTLETLNTIALEISSTLDESLLMESSLTVLADLIGVSHGSIMLIEPETEHLVDRSVLGRKDSIGYIRFPIGQGIVGWVAQHRKPAFVGDISKDSRWLPLPANENMRKTSGSMIAVPLIAHHELQGVLVLSHDQPNYFREQHMRLLSASASQIAIGLHNAIIYKEVEQQLLHRYEMQRRQEEIISQSTAILQSLSDGVIVCDAYGGVLAANPAAERILERPLEELVIWNLPELMKRLLAKRANEIPVEDLLSQWADQGARSTCSTTFEIHNRVISLTLDPVVFSGKDTLLGAVAVFRDITREVESDRLKTEFIGTVSHELRTPMTSIKGFTQLLAMGSLGPVNDSQKEFLTIIQTNAERMIAIINDLLDITKIETGSVDLDLRPIHVAEAISTVVLELRPKIQERTLELSISIPPGLPLVRADAKRFNQILFNLLSNAVKYTQRDGKIAMEAHEMNQNTLPAAVREGLQQGKRYVQVDVRDSGVGIAHEELDRIFERFYRTENPLKVEAGGTGLGLSLVRPLLKLFSGHIWVESTLGEGSTFSFILPAA